MLSISQAEFPFYVRNGAQILKMPPLILKSEPFRLLRYKLSFWATESPPQTTVHVES